MSRRSAASLAAAAALLVLVADQASKAWARSALRPGHEVMVVTGWVWFRIVSNTGAALGLLSGNNWLFIVVSLVIVAAVAVLVIRNRALGALGIVALGAVAGGGSSNLIDRVRLGGVTDFIEVHRWPTDFNLADAAIRIGVVLFIVALLLDLRHRRPTA